MGKVYMIAHNIAMCAIFEYPVKFLDIVFYVDAVKLKDFAFLIYILL